MHVVVCWFTSEKITLLCILILIFPLTVSCLNKSTMDDNVIFCCCSIKLNVKLKMYQLIVYILLLSLHQNSIHVVIRPTLQGK